MSFATIARPGRNPLDRPSPASGVFTEVESTSPIAPPSGSADANVRAARTEPRNTVSNALVHWSSLMLDAVPGAGHGLRGMRERVAAYDGTLVAAAHADGGFRVAARIPYPAVGEDGRP